MPSIADARRTSTASGGASVFVCILAISRKRMQKSAPHKIEKTGDFLTISRVRVCALASRG